MSLETRADDPDDKVGDLLGSFRDERPTATDARRTNEDDAGMPSVPPRSAPVEVAGSGAVAPAEAAPRAPLTTGEPVHDYEARFADIYAAARHPAVQLLNDAAAAEDVATEVMARLYMRWERMDDDAAEFWAVRETTEMALRQATKRKHKAALWEAEDRLRDEKGENKEAGSPLSASRAGTPRSVDTGIERKLGESRPQIITSVAKLPAKKRRVVALKYFADLSDEQIAKGLSLPVAVVQLRIEQSLDELSDRLGPDLGGLDDLA